MDEWMDEWIHRWMDKWPEAKAGFTSDLGSPSSKSLSVPTSKKRELVSLMPQPVCVGILGPQDRTGFQREPLGREGPVITPGPLALASGLLWGP